MYLEIFIKCVFNTYVYFENYYSGNNVKLCLGSKQYCNYY